MGKINMLNDPMAIELSKRYFISEDGKCFDIAKQKNVVFSKDCKGYLKARIYCPCFSKHKDRRKSFRLHRLVAMFYINNYSNDLQVNHKNGIKDDNRVENLEMVNNSQNVYHAWNYLDSQSRKEKLNKSRNTKGQFSSRLFAPDMKPETEQGILI